MPARALAAVVPDRASVADDTARAIAWALREGFDRHYALFRDCARAAKRHFETRDWRALAQCRARPHRLLRPAGAGDGRPDRARIPLSGSRWRRRRRLVERVKLHYIGLLIDHKQPECAETFFNSVSCKILHRTYFHNRFIFVRPTVSTEHIDADPPSYRSYYPLVQGCAQALIDIVARLPARDALRGLPPRSAHLLAAFRARTAAPFGPRPIIRSRCSRRCSSRPDCLCGRPRRERHAQRAVRGGAEARRPTAASTSTRC
jgi:isocitrate dehydrogenase kinase/phosphatase